MRHPPYEGSWHSREDRSRREFDLSTTRFPEFGDDGGPWRQVAVAHGFNARDGFLLFELTCDSATPSRRCRGLRRAFAPDMPGFGQADKPADFDYTVDGYAKHLARLLDAGDQAGSSGVA
jgi:pimeloyl-ACP methyl ester carboxylesterase